MSNADASTERPLFQEDLCIIYRFIVVFHIRLNGQYVPGM